MEAMIERRRRLLGDLKIYYSVPFEPVRASGVHVWDKQGRLYLDAYNNVPHVGHCDPQVTEALCEQAHKLNTNTRYLFDSVLEYAEKLTATLPAELHACMFTCTGSEANDLAWRVARAWSGGDGVITSQNAYHGNTTFLNEIDGSRTSPFVSVTDWWRSVPAPNPDSSDPALSTSSGYAAGIDRAIQELCAAGHKPAAFFLDTFFCSDGIRVASDRLIAEAVERVRAAGGLIIADEVQAGLSRTGLKWGFEHLGVIPDIITCGKPLGNGHPIGVLVARGEIVERFFQTNQYFNTFSGNPVSCAAGIAVLDIIERKKLRENAGSVGMRLIEELKKLQGRHEIIGDVRGRGLLIGVELVRDRATSEPAGPQAQFVIDELCRRGVLVGLTGPNRKSRNLLKIRPPIIFDHGNVDQLIGTLDETLKLASSTSIQLNV